MKQPIPSKLLDLLVCPLTKTKLIYDQENNQLLSEEAGLSYLIHDGIPILLIDQATIIDHKKAEKYQNFFVEEK